MRFLKSFIILIFCTNFLFAQEFISKKAILDISSYNYYSNRPVKLNGEWLFCCNKFTLDKIEPHKQSFINVPGKWTLDSTSFLNSSQSGFATYELKVILPEEGKLWAIYLPPIHSAYTLYIDKRKVAQVGELGSDNSMTPAIFTKVVHFVAYQKKVTLTLHVSNFNYVMGGIVSAIELGNPTAIANRRENSFFISAFLMGSLTIMGLYHFALFSLLKKDKEYLYFGVLCIFLAIRETFGGDAIFYKYFPNVNHEFSIKILFSVFPICLFSITLFFSRLYQNFSRLLKRIALILSSSFFLMVLITNNIFYGNFIFLISLFFFIECIYLMFLVSKKTYQDPKNNILILLGLITLIYCLINDVLSDAQIIHTYFIIPLGFFIFTLCQSITLSIRFANAFKKSESLELKLTKIEAGFQQEILKAQLEIQERTFESISQEIHDNIGQILMVIKLHLNSFDVEVSEKIATARDLVGKVIKDLRNLSKSINGNNIIELGLLNAIQNELKLLQQSGAMETSFQSLGEPFIWDSKKELILFRIVQEAIHNVIKHANASEVKVMANFENQIFELIVLDNGVGFDLERKNSFGNGLKNMENRCKLIGGIFNVISENQKGTSISIKITQ
jgi:signal transduction histidine kinase